MQQCGAATGLQCQAIPGHKHAALTAQRRRKTVHSVEDTNKVSVHLACKSKTEHQLVAGSISN